MAVHKGNIKAYSCAWVTEPATFPLNSSLIYKCKRERLSVRLNTEQRFAPPPPSILPHTSTHPNLPFFNKETSPWVLMLACSRCSAQGMLRITQIKAFLFLGYFSTHWRTIGSCCSQAVAVVYRRGGERPPNHPPKTLQAWGLAKSMDNSNSSSFFFSSTVFSMQEPSKPRATPSIFPALKKRATLSDLYAPTRRSPIDSGPNAAIPRRRGCPYLQGNWRTW